jgi:calmodulin
MAGLTEEQIAEIKEVFTLFDKNGDDTIVASELGTVMRSLGKNPTEAELQEMIKEADNGKGFISFESFKALLSKVSKLDANRTEELLSAFKELDEGNVGSLDVGEFRYMMTRLGEQLTQEEAQEMIKEIGVDEKRRINYLEYIKSIGSE